MSTSVEQLDERLRRQADRFGETVVHRGELLRHPVYTRVLHWLVAIAFVLSLLSGFALYSPWLFRFLTPIFGGGAMTRLLHPWFGLFFDIFFLFQFLNWFAPMAWTSADTRWLKRIKRYTSNQDKMEPEEVGFFNGGQKLYFWAIVLSGVLFLITGLLMWFDHVVPRWIVAVSYVIHDLAALLMLAGFIIHIYEGTGAMPGTFRAMTNGTVTEKWAWTHHPAWYRALTGRNSREAYERDKRRQSERQQVVAAWESEYDSRENSRPDLTGTSSKTNQEV
ncbi:MAG TPA: formate dehydrogenase subunit gamma [Pyrinomonadaceae bacterium]|jgi:formate dehydrogenase subunit gamma|nr:formate dehydrogenase subunit gamma [Pyrinomonadaceae bacterium]